MTDFSHLDALFARLSREKGRLAEATTRSEIEFRQREIVACEKEIAGEYKFLGIKQMTLDEILADDLVMSDGETATDPSSP